MKDGEKILPKPIKALDLTSLHLTSSVSESTGRRKLEDLSKNRFPKTERLQMIQYHGWTVVDRQNPNLQFERNVLSQFCGGKCVSIQEVIERTEMSYTKPEPNSKNGIRTAVADTERKTQCQPV